LDECEFVVFVLSPDFFNSEWAQVERTSSIADDPGERQRKDLDYPSVRLNILTTEEGVGSSTREQDGSATTLPRWWLALAGCRLRWNWPKGYLNYRKELTIASLLGEMSAASDIELLAEFASEYLDHLPTRHETGIVRTFQLSWDAAPELARAVLRAMGELALVAVPRSLLRSVLNLPAGSGMSDPLARALDELSRLSLVELDTSANPIAHRLILAFTRHRNVADSASPVDQCLAAIQERMGQASLTPDAGTIRELNLLAPHAESLLEGSLIRPEDFSELAGRLGTHYLALGRSSHARRVLTEALASAEKTFEPGHPSIARTQSNLALVLKDLGQLEEARELLRKAHRAYLSRFGPDHPHTQTIQRNLEGLGN
jgi:tetratricopeptide (TPR) repeat protein